MTPTKTPEFEHAKKWLKEHRLELLAYLKHGIANAADVVSALAEYKSEPPLPEQKRYTEACEALAKAAEAHDAFVNNATIAPANVTKYERESARLSREYNLALGYFRDAQADLAKVPA